MEALIGRARTGEAATCTEPDTATWIWSDLHLGHEHSRSAFGRPFRTAAAADEAMMDAWYEQVADGETIICLGRAGGRARAGHQPKEDRASGNGWRPVQRRAQRSGVDHLNNEQTGGHRDRNQRRAFSAVWWSTPKCFAIALTRMPRACMGTASGAISW